MAGTRRTATFDWRGFLLLCGIYLVVVLLWDHALIFPLKVFVVLCHEISHGVAAVLTGGSILRIEVNDNLGGLTMTRDGIPIVITAAGYLGSLLFGVAFLLVSTRTRLAPALALVTGLLITLIAWRYMPPETFGRRFAFVMGVLLAAVAALPRPVPELTLRVLGITSCLYAVLDMKSDILDQDHPRSDAAVLEAQTGVPAYLWGILWIGTSFVVTAIAAKWAVTRTAPADKQPGKKK